MFYLNSNFLPKPKLVPLLEYCCQWSETDRNLGDKATRQGLFKVLGWPVELEEGTTILIGKLEPGVTMKIHKDRNKSEYEARSAFNIPVTDNAGFEWYRGITEEVDNRPAGDQGFPMLEFSEAELVATHDCASAFWVSTENWHRMINTGNKTAWMLSFRWPGLSDLSVNQIVPEIHYPWISNIP